MEEKILIEDFQQEEETLDVSAELKKTIEKEVASFSKYLSASQSNNAVAMRTLAKDCFLSGDQELISDDSLFLFGLMGQMSKMIEMRQGLLVNLSKPGK